MGQLRRGTVVLAWALATVLAGGVAWWAVGTVGRGSGSIDSSVLSGAQVASALAARQALVTPTPTGSPTPTTSPTTSPTVEPTPTTTPTAEPTATTPPPTEIARTWTVTGGVVSVSCLGDQITLLGATPSDGWGVERKSQGPGELKIEFDLHEEAETTVTARCVAGTPEAQVSNESEDDRSEDD
jgi:hypothetical protein